MTRRILLLPVGVVLVAFMACGGTDDGRPSPEPTPAPEEPPCEAADGYEFQTIVDFDYTSPVGTAQCDPAVFIVTDPRDPSCMYMNYDSAHSEGGEFCEESVRPGQFPLLQPGPARNIRGEPIEGGRCGVEESALHLVGQNIAMCYAPTGRLGWGASLEVLLTTSAALDADAGMGGAGGATGSGGAPGSGGAAGSGDDGANGFDASDWDGISFWIRRGGGPSGAAFIMTVSDPATSGVPYCSTVESAPDAEKCDAFGVAVTLTDEWTFIAAPFSSLRQKGFGVRSPFGEIDQGNIARLNFLVSAGDWDLWLDDVSFYRSK